MTDINPLACVAEKYDIVLASGSPRRQELLAMLDLPFTVDTSHSVDETHPEGCPAEEIPVYLSVRKANAVTLRPDDRRLIITADTVVVLDGDILEKPVDEADACMMLARMAGKKQTVVTGVTVRSADRSVTFSNHTEVSFAPLSEEEIEFYVRKFKPLDKAGAYGIQEWIGAAAISGINGSFYNVMGLPVHQLYKVLCENFR